MNPQTTTPQKKEDPELDQLYDGFQQKHLMFLNKSQDKDASGIIINSQESFISLQQRQQSSIQMDSFDDGPINIQNPQSVLKKNKKKELSKQISFHPNLELSKPDQHQQKPADQEHKPSLTISRVISLKKISQQFQKKQSIFRRRTMARLGFQKPIWRKNGLKVLVLVSRAILAFMALITKIKLKFVDQKIFDIIEDNASNYEYLRKRKLVKDKPTILDKIENKFKILQKIDIYLNSLEQFVCSNYTFVFQPDTFLKVIYDLILIIIITGTISFVPLQYSFNLEYDSDSLQILIFEIVPAYVFLVEIIVNLNSAYYSRGKIIMARGQIIKHYILKGNFCWDVLLTSLLFFKQYFPRSMSLLLILRVYRVEDVYNQLIAILNLRDRFSQSLSLIKLIYLLMLISHLIACYWHFLGDYQIRVWKEDSWLITYQLYDTTWQVKYVNSLYWAIISTTTVGYGDICPQTILEKISTIITTLFSSVVFGYMISSIGSIFSQMNEENEKFLNTMASINNYIKKRNLSPQMQLKVRIQKGNDNEIKELIDQIPSELKKDIRVDLYSKYLKKVSFISQSLSDTTIQSLCMVATEHKLQPDEILFKQDEEVERLVILLNGSMESFVETQKFSVQQNLLTKNFILQTNDKKRKIMLKKFTKGSVFHEREFLLSNKTFFATKALTTANILVIQKKDLMNVLENQHQDFERLHMLIENTQHNHSYRLIYHACEICNQNHNFFRCPFTFFQVDRQKVQKEMKKNQDHQRQKDHFRKYKFFPGYRTCRLDYLDCAIQSGLNGFQIQEEDINDEFLQNVGFPMVVIKETKETKSKHQSIISEKLEEDSDEENQQNLVQIKEQDEVESQNSSKNNQIQHSFLLESQDSQSEISSKYEKKRLTIPKFNNIQDEEERQPRNSGVQPNFALMDKVRKFSLVKGVELGLKKDYVDSSKKKDSLFMKQKTPKETFKSSSIKSMKSQTSYQRADSGSKKNFQSLYAKNVDRVGLTPIPQPNQAALSFGQLAEKYRRLSTVQAIEPMTFQQPVNPIHPKQSIFQQQASLTSQGTPQGRNSKMLINLQQQIQQQFEQYNMIQQIEFEYHLANHRENFIDVDMQGIPIIKYLDRCKTYEYYFPNFNIQRVLSKYAGYKKKKINKKLSQVEFQMIRQQTKAFSKIQKSQTLVEKRHKTSLNSREFNEI